MLYASFRLRQTQKTVSNIHAAVFRSRNTHPLLAHFQQSTALCAFCFAMTTTADHGGTHSVPPNVFHVNDWENAINVQEPLYQQYICSRTRALSMGMVSITRKHPERDGSGGVSLSFAGESRKQGI